MLTWSTLKSRSPWPVGGLCKCNGLIVQKDLSNTHNYVLGSLGHFSIRSTCARFKIKCLKDPADYRREFAGVYIPHTLSV